MPVSYKPTYVVEDGVRYYYGASPSFQPDGFFLAAPIYDRRSLAPISAEEKAEIEEERRQRRANEKLRVLKGIMVSSYVFLVYLLLLRKRELIRFSSPTEIAQDRLEAHSFLYSSSSNSHFCSTCSSTPHHRHSRRHSFSHLPFIFPFYRRRGSALHYLSQGHQLQPPSSEVYLRAPHRRVEGEERNGFVYRLPLTHQDQLPPVD
jgi:hypothetical protein